MFYLSGFGRSQAGKPRQLPLKLFCPVLHVNCVERHFPLQSPSPLLNVCLFLLGLLVTLIRLWLNISFNREFQKDWICRISQWCMIIDHMKLFYFFVSKGGYLHFLYGCSEYVLGVVDDAMTEIFLCLLRIILWIARGLKSPHKSGLLRKLCKRMALWNVYFCFGQWHRMAVFKKYIDSKWKFWLIGQLT